MIRPLMPLILGLLLPASAARAEDYPSFRFTGTVTRVKDGDSMMVRRDDVPRQSEVRLAGVDAPELGQPWGLEARSALRRMVHGKRVTVEVTDRDRYERLVGRVYVGPHHVNARMACGGHAWAFARYLPDREIRACHDAARKASLGFWALPPEQRLPPATWRARNSRPSTMARPGPRND